MPPSCSRWRSSPRSGVRNFPVELAATDGKLDRGLMYRRELPEGRGMLFDFKEDRPVGMWMKNTYIPLDMLFIRSDGTIVKIAEKTKPHSLENIMSGPPVRARAGGDRRNAPGSSE